MNIAAVTSFKHGDIWRLLAKLGWSQIELSRRSGVKAQTIGDIIRLRSRPSANAADKIQAAFAAEGEFLDVLGLWPESFKGFNKTPKVIQIEDVTEESLTACNLENKEKVERLENVIKLLKGRNQKDVMTRLYIIGESRGKVMEDLKFSSQRMATIEQKALKKLRSPASKKFILGENDFSDETALILATRENANDYKKDAK